MKKKKLIRLAIDALKKQRQPHAIGNNLYFIGIISEMAKTDHKIYTELTEAINFLENLKNNA